MTSAADPLHQARAPLRQLRAHALAVWCEPFGSNSCRDKSHHAHIHDPYGENRMYMLAGTSAGHVYPLTAAPLPNKIIFQLHMQNDIRTVGGAVRRNSLADISVLQKISFAMKGGVVFKK